MDQHDYSRRSAIQLLVGVSNTLLQQHYGRVQVSTHVYQNVGRQWSQVQYFQSHDS